MAEMNLEEVVLCCAFLGSKNDTEQVDLGTIDQT